MSLPMWERGLKSEVDAYRFAKYAVAPHVGAWIEIQWYQIPRHVYDVAPHVGAWIEISSEWQESEINNRSLPMWERGLKFGDNPDELKMKQSLPMWERGLKLRSPVANCN